jgi:benzoate/toluate 1,2-dioxygenase alpha subunit
MTIGAKAADAPWSNVLEVNENGIRRLNRRIYTDEEIFEAEIQNIWEKVWIFLGHESQIPVAGDYLTTYIGRQPIIVNRTKDGRISAFINACRHRGATLCRKKKGNARHFACPYHSWVYDQDGHLLSVKNEHGGAYPESFDKGDLGLVRVPRLENYRGFLFGSLNADVVSLSDYLGSASVFIDLMVDQSPNGLEVLRGESTYTYDGNWKLQIENGVDGYHATTVHWNLIEVERNRKKVDVGLERPRPMNSLSDGRQLGMGYFDLGHGHSVIWNEWGNLTERFNYGDWPDMEARVGPVRTKWALGHLRNLLVFPSMFAMDSASSQIRIIRPISVDKTEVTIFVVAPVGEPADQRRMRLRFYEDFFNATGMATPDDLAEFEGCQTGFYGTHAPWSDLSRGVSREAGPTTAAENELGLVLQTSSVSKEDEGIFIGQYRYWSELMSAGEELADG